MKALFTVTSALEAATGVGLAVAPSWAAQFLLGAPLDSPPGLTLGRVLGAALVAIGAACLGARDDARGRAASGLVAALLLYNAAVVAVLAYARIALGVSGVGLWPAVVLHSALAAWCVAGLVSGRPAA